MKKAIIIGATSGIGREVARQLTEKGWLLGIAGRRENALHQLAAQYPGQISTQRIDVLQDDAPARLRELIGKAGGMDVFLLCSGIGFYNEELQPEPELATARTNVIGFIRMTTAAFLYFKEKGEGHIAVISSIAGTKGLGAAPAYSATKCFQATYIDALAQLAHMQKLRLRFTDVRPGFVATDLLKDRSYPMTMAVGKVARRIVTALERRKRVVVIDWRYRILVFLWRLLPFRMWERMTIRCRK